MANRKEGNKRSEDRDFLPNSLESAAQEAAMADGLIPTESNDMKMKKANLRRGKWTAEEESYANRLIYEFKLGLLPLTDGTTLRTFLSKLLNCDPMRISKKFVGQNCIGKQVFRRRQQDLDKLTPEQIETSRKELAELERKFLERVAQTNRTKSTEGKGYEEDGNGTTAASAVAPWMLPPESMEDSTRGHSARSFPTDAAASYALAQQQGLYPGGGVHGKLPVYAPGSAELDYHQQLLSHNNAALMSHFLQQHAAAAAAANNGTGNGTSGGGIVPFSYFPQSAGYEYSTGGHADSSAQSKADGHGASSASGGNGEHRYDLLHHSHHPHHQVALQQQQQQQQQQQFIENMQRMGYFPSWALPPPTSHPDAHQQQQQQQQQYLQHLFGRSASPAPLQSVGGQSAHNTSSSATALHTSASGMIAGHDWPSMTSLMGVGGESMENIAQLLTQYHSQSQADHLAAEGAEGQGQSEGRGTGSSGTASHPVVKRERGADDVGLPLDEALVPSSSVSGKAAVTGLRSTQQGMTQPVHQLPDRDKKPPAGKWQDRIPEQQPQAHHVQQSQTRFALSPDAMTAMAQMYHYSSSGQEAERDKATSSFPSMKSEKGSAGSSGEAAAVGNGAHGASGAGSSGSTSSEAHSSVPRNSSVENFWMLVNMGDLPRPDQDVLSEVVFDYQKTNTPSTTARTPQSKAEAPPPSTGSAVSARAGSESESAVQTMETEQSVSAADTTGPSFSSTTTTTTMKKKRESEEAAEDGLGLSLDDEHRSGADRADWTHLQKKLKVEER